MESRRDKLKQALSADDRVADASLGEVAELERQPDLTFSRAAARAAA